MVVSTIPVVYCICMFYKWWTDIYEEDKEDRGEEEEERQAEEGEENDEEKRRGGGEEEETNHEDDKEDDFVFHSVNKISNCFHISLLAKTTLLIKSDSTNTH